MVFIPKIGGLHPDSRPEKSCGPLRGIAVMVGVGLFMLIFALEGASPELRAGVPDFLMFWN